MTTKATHSPYILCADIGGSHMTAAVCDISDHSIIADSELRVDIDSKASAELILSNWTRTLKEILEKTDVPVSGLAIAMPGPFDYENGVSYIQKLDKYESLYGTNIKQHFSRELRLDASLIKFRNDAEATIAGECIAGAGKGFDRVMGITLGTGFGSAYSRDGLIKDLNLGSLPYRDSIADDHFSTRWFVKRYHEFSGNTVKNVKELTLLTSEWDTVIAVFKEFGDNLGSFLITQQEQYAPDLLLICGNIARASYLFFHSLKSKLPGKQIELAQLGENAALIGAASLFGINVVSLPTINQINNI